MLKESRDLVAQMNRGAGTWIFVFVATVGILGIALGLRTADASHFDNMYKTTNANWNCSNGGSFCQTDNSSYTWYPESSLSSFGYDTLQLVMAYEYDPTDLTAIQESTPSYTGGSETDVIFQYGYLPPEAAGMAWCDDAISSSVCDQHYAKFNTSGPSYALACHETGHTVGLTHGADAYPSQSDYTWDLGCMGTANQNSVGSHNQSQINSTY